MNCVFTIKNIAPQTLTASAFPPDALYGKTTDTVGGKEFRMPDYVNDYINENGKAADGWLYMSFTGSGIPEFVQSDATIALYSNGTLHYFEEYGGPIIVDENTAVLGELADDIAVTVNGEITLTGSVFAYCNAVMTKNGQTDAAKNAMAAFYEYHKAALEYTSFEVCFPVLENYKIYTADGEEIQKGITIKFYKPLSFRVVPEENYVVSSVYSEGYVESDESGLYTLSFVGGKHEVEVNVTPVTVNFTVYLPCEDGTGMLPNTKVSFEYGNETVNGSLESPGRYNLSAPIGTKGTIVVIKEGYLEYRQEYTADGTSDEITASLTPSEE